MRMVWSTLYVSSLEKSLSFYKEVLGLSVNKQYQTPDGAQIVFLSDGTMSEVELIQAPDRPAFAGSGICLGFEIASIEAEMERMGKLGIPIEKGPFTVGGGVRFFFIKDPDGLDIQLVAMP